VHSHGSFFVDLVDPIDVFSWLVWQLTSILSTPIASSTRSVSSTQSVFTRIDPSLASILHRHRQHMPIHSLSPLASTRRSRSLLRMLALNVVRSILLPPCRSSTSTRSIHRHTADCSLHGDTRRSVMDCLSPGTMVAVVVPGTISNECWMIKEICLFGETDQFVRNCKHCCSAASCGCGIFWSLPCCWLGCTSMCSQVHICSLWNASCASNRHAFACIAIVDGGINCRIQAQDGSWLAEFVVDRLQWWLRRKAAGIRAGTVLFAWLPRQGCFIGKCWRDPLVRLLQQISLPMKHECCSCCAAGCHGSFWSLLCC